MTGAADPALAVTQLLPARRTEDLDSILGAVLAAPVAAPFHPERVAFVADASRALGRAAKGHPEIQALAFWMRRTELSRMQESFADLGSARILLMPRGTVFHIPPANVDTIFVYSWVLSTLVGNRNIVRLSARVAEQSLLIVNTLNAVLADHPAVAETTAMLTYGHDDAITSRISSAVDVRVIWGGDETIRHIRALPLPAHATELCFADRFSMAAISTGTYLNLNESERDRLAEDFFNDVYWFDQMGCSSARLLIWAGPEDPAGPARDFQDRVTAVGARKSYVVDTSAAIAKLSQAYRSIIDDSVIGYHRPDNILTVLEMADFPEARGDFCGGGLLYQLHLQHLADISPHIRRSDQTLATFGFSSEELLDLATGLEGRGIDRIVPIGQALRFSRYWDGYDILSELTRKVTLGAEA